MKICKKCINFIKVKFQMTFKDLEEHEFKCAEGVTSLSNEKVITECNQLKTFSESLEEYSKDKRTCQECGGEGCFIAGARYYCEKCQRSF